MKKVLLTTLTAFSFSILIEPIHAGLFGSKDPSVESLNKFATAIDALAKEAASLSTKSDDTARRDFTKQDDVSPLIPLRAATKNASEFLSWIKLLVTKIKESVEKLKKAEEKTTSSSQGTIATAKTDINKLLKLMLGKGINSLRANVRASFLVYLKIMADKASYSAAGASSMQRDLTALASKITAAANVLQEFSTTLKGLQSSEGLEMDQAKLDKLIADISATCEFLSKIPVYYAGQGLSPQDVNTLMQKCSFKRGAGGQTTYSPTMSGQTTAPYSASPNGLNGQMAGTTMPTTNAGTYAPTNGQMTAGYPMTTPNAQNGAIRQ
ncbi:MAG: hypothetical protein LBL99_03250 [Holosporaceae bacterium]|jgi:hypothetical protein|nr:hypothetical protein [Holosporaceae bacterium]